jgi:DNA topoisomerase-1
MDAADSQRRHRRRVKKAAYRRAATHAGLRYVTDGARGIRRKRVGGGWAYYAPGGARITDHQIRKRLNSLAIPPAWTEVWICPDPDGHIQATARDAAGRKQYRYHSEYREARDRSKFRRMLEFSEVLPRLRERIERDLRSKDLGRKQLLATVVMLLDKTLIRVGNDEYMRANRSYGLTTMRRRHLQIEGSVLRFSFRGKSGVEHTITVADPRLARIIQRCRDLPGQELFQYLDAGKRRHLVSSDDVNDYLRELAGRDVSAKDFRTWGGTMLAAVELRRRGEAASRREADRNIIAAIDAVAERLGNTRSVCRKYYVHPALIDAYRMGETIPQPPPVRRTRRHHGAALRRDEVLVLQFLQERL